jgi:hypothetical protein
MRWHAVNREFAGRRDASPVGTLVRRTAWQWLGHGEQGRSDHDLLGPTVLLSVQMLTFRGSTSPFDSSDLMPDAAQNFEWKQLTAWFAEAKPTREVRRAIDAPRSPRRGTPPP